MKHKPALLIVDSDVLVRHHLAEYLRDCGYHVIEATSSEEALAFLEEEAVPVQAALVELNIAGAMNGFALAQWIRSTLAGIDVLLVGTLEGAAERAGELCDDEEPTLRKPYSPQVVLQRIKRMKAERDRNGNA